MKNERVVLVTISPLLPGPVAVVALLAVLLVVMLPPGRKKKLGSKLKITKVGVFICEKC